MPKPSTREPQICFEVRACSCQARPTPHQRRNRTPATGTCEQPSPGRGRGYMSATKKGARSGGQTPLRMCVCAGRGSRRCPRRRGSSHSPTFPGDGTLLEVHCATCRAERHFSIDRSGSVCRFGGRFRRVAVCSKCGSRNTEIRTMSETLEVIDRSLTALGLLSTQVFLTDMALRDEMGVIFGGPCPLVQEDIARGRSYISRAAHRQRAVGRGRPLLPNSSCRPPPVHL